MLVSCKRIKTGDWGYNSRIEVPSHIGALRGISGALTDLALALAVTWNSGLAGQEKLIRPLHSLSLCRSCGHKWGFVQHEV